MNTNVRDEQVWLAVASLAILATVALAGTLVYTREVMIPFILALFITTVVSPIVDYQVMRWHVSSWIAVSGALAVVITILVLLGLVLIVAVQTIVETANEYSDQVVELAQRMFARLSARNIHIDQARISEELEASLPQIITEAVGTVSTVFTSGFLIMIFVIFLLVGRNPERRQAGIYADIEASIRGYITTKTTISAVAGLLVGFVLWTLGLRMFWLFGVLAFLFNYIPNIGPIIATLLPIPIAVAQFADPWRVGIVVLVPGLIHMTIGNVVEPKIMGRGLELHPVTILLALAFWGLLWGVMGMVLAVPITGTLRIVFSRFTTTHWLGNLLAGYLPGAAPPPAATARPTF